MLRLALRGQARPMLITDAMPPVGGACREFSLFGTRVRVQEEACVDERGTLAGTALTMASAVRNCVQLLDVPLSLALRPASLEPATFLGLADHLGRLAPEFQADMVALQPESMHVLGTWVGGVWRDSTADTIC